MRSMMVGLALAAAASGWAAPAQAPGFVALAKLERGQWTLREGAGERRSMCISDPTVLLQIRNRGAGCSRFVIDNSPTSATIHYTCPGAGHGRTTIRVETPRLVRIETQGLDGGAPFDLEIEARRIGSCGARG